LSAQNPAEVCQSRLFKYLRWQRDLTATTDAKGLLAALATIAGTVLNFLLAVWLLFAIAITGSMALDNAGRGSSFEETRQ